MSDMLITTSGLPPTFWNAGWNGQSHIDGPSFAQSYANGFVLDSGYLGPFGEGFGLTAKFKISIGSLVSRLFFFGSPFAVFRAIYSLIVDTLKTTFQARTLSHIGKEPFKFKPLAANSNAAPAVVRIICARWISRSLNERLPYFVFPRSAKSMSPSGVPNALPVETSATVGTPVSQRHSQNGSHLSAFAFAVPFEDARDFRLGERNDRPSSKDHSGQVLESRVIGNRMNLSHDARSFKAGNWLEVDSGYSPSRPRSIVQGRAA
jgi:hypothetical protein